jgi:hypothetical protein
VLTNFLTSVINELSGRVDKEVEATMAPPKVGLLYFE